MQPRRMSPRVVYRRLSYATIHTFHTNEYRFWMQCAPLHWLALTPFYLQVLHWRSMILPSCYQRGLSKLLYFEQLLQGLVLVYDTGPLLYIRQIAHGVILKRRCPLGYELR